ncbi:MAG TPA: tetratricopeptide repeat protein [Thermoanaerobaculaceae bacterium]|nr:tetratricopeptide repeat protein [Thermoanaerobaculaceae bacterium]HPS77288.1 tetratricopeptide repeat protein [Thermoanaerobaculaceae bacterium]
MRPPIRFTVAKEFLPIQIAPSDPQWIESAAFTETARRFYESQFGDGAVEVQAVPGGLVVTWTPTEAQLDPFEYAVGLLQNRQHRLAVPLLQGLLKTEPDHPGVLFNLGMAESDLGNLDDAIVHLRALVEMDPGHAHGWVALGVARARAGQIDEAIAALGEAVRVAPEDPYARRNLGGLLGKKGLLADAVIHLREAVRLLPADQQALYGLAHTLLTVSADDHAGEADALFQRAIAADPDSDLAEICRKERSRVAQSTFRSNAAGQVRMDAVMYCLGALQTFAKMPKENVRKVTFEIALLGTRGLDVNDPAQKYQLRSLPGQFSGLHLVSIEYVGFKLLDPTVDIGFDLSREYRQAQLLFGGESEPRP